MNFKELREEVVARGFDDFEQSDSRIKRWVNQACREIADAYRWPFLEATKEGTAPLTISDLGHVLSVVDFTHEAPLRYRDRRAILRDDPALSGTGSANVWYREDESSVKVYPADTTSTFKVRYQKTPAELSADGDLSPIPTAYHDLIVDGAVVRAFKNRSDYEGAQAIRTEWERGLRQMAHALLHPNYDSNLTIVRAGQRADYL